MQSQFEDRIKKLEEEKALLKKKMEEMHNALLKRSQYNDDKV